MESLRSGAVRTRAFAALVVLATGGAAWHRLLVRTSLPTGVRVEQGLGGLERIVVDHAQVSAELYLQGATLTRWMPAGQGAVVWTSPKAVYAPGKAIRGGVPICFPWFGPHPTHTARPQHGFARTAPWTLVSAVDDPATGAVELALALADTDATRALWPHAFRATYGVRLGAKLELSLTVENVGETALRYQDALHSYFVVSDVRAVSVRGLEGATYVDKTAGGARRVEGNVPVRLAGETDRVYRHDAGAEIIDPGLGRTLSVQKDSARSTILWNPWHERARALSDLGEDAWTTMLCLESGNVADDAITLAPGTSHTTRVRVVVNPVLGRTDRA